MTVMKRIAGIALAAGLLYGGASSAAAAVPAFADVERDAPWALGSVTELALRGVFSGYPNGTFGPNKDVTRIEALAAVVRHMGLREEAESSEAKRAKLSAADAVFIQKNYDWAVGYVEVAEDQGLLLDEKAALKPGTSADRVWATTLLVRALGLERAAEAAMASELSFGDAGSIPEESVGYVAVAVQYGLVTGYEDNTFRPTRLVSRAELATLLDRAGDKLPNGGGPFAQTGGTVRSVNGSNVTLQQTGASQPFFIGAEAIVVRGGRKAAPGELMPGDEITILLRDGAAVLVNVTKAASVADGTKPGTIGLIENGTVTIIDERGAQMDYKLHQQAAISKNGSPISWLDLKAGDQVTVTISGGYITKVEAHRTQLQYGRVVGLLKDIDESEVTVTTDGADSTYPLRADTEILVNYAPADIASLRKGEETNLVIENGAVRQINVLQELTDVTVYVSAVYETHLMVAKDGREDMLILTQDVQVFREGRPAALTDLKPGDQVKAMLRDGGVFMLTVVEPVEKDPEVMDIEGVYQGHLSAPGGKVTEISITIQYKGNPIVRSFPVWSDAMFLSESEGNFLNGTQVPTLHYNFSKLKLTVINQQVTMIYILDLL